MKKTAFNWTRLLRTMVALLVIMSMVLCGCAGADVEGDEDEGGKNNSSQGDSLIKGDGDGKLEAEDVVDNVTGIYGTLLGLVGGDKNSLTNGGYSMEMSVVLGDSLMEQLSQMLEYQGLDADLSWFKSLGIAMDVIYNDNLSQIDMEAKLNGTGILSVEAVADLMAASVFLRIPELSNQFIGGQTDLDMDMEDFVEMYNKTLEAMEEYGTVVEALPTEKELNTLLSRYLEAGKVALGSPVTGTETLTAGGISLEVTASTYTIHISDMVDMVEAILNTAKTDAELETMLDEFTTWYNEMMAKEMDGWNAVDLHEELLEVIEDGLEEMAEAKAELENGDQEDKEILTLSNYLKDEKSMGFALSVNGEYESTSIYMYNLEKDGQTAFVMNMADTMVLEGNGTVSGDKVSGTYTLSTYGEELLFVEVVDFDTKALKQGHIKGTLRLRFSEDALGYNSVLTPETVLELVFDMGDGKTSLGINIHMEGGLLFGVQMAVNALSGKVSLPNDYIDVNNSSALQDWVAGISFDKVLRNLRSAGVSSELVDMLEQALGQVTG